MRQAAQNLAIDAFRALASQFDDAPLPVRREIARELKRAADSLLWTDPVPLADSPNIGERAGAAIGLRVQLRRSLEARDQSCRREALRRSRFTGAVSSRGAASGNPRAPPDLR
jgi:hypothetical protein